MMNYSKTRHLETKTQNKIDNSFIRRYIILNPVFNQIDEIMKRYFNIYKKGSENCLVSCVLKLLTTTNRVSYIRTKTKLHFDFFLFSRNSILSRINKGRYFLPHIYQMRTTFSSSFRELTYKHYLKQPIPMFENTLNQILAKNPTVIYRSNGYSDYPFMRKDTNQWIIFVSEKN